MNILGISAGFHDAGIALITNGDLVYASHSERFSGIKHDSKINVNMINDAIKKLSDDQQIDKIAYYERPWMRYARQLRTGEASWPKKTDFSIKSILPKFLLKMSN